MEQITVRLSTEVIDELDEAADDRGTSRAEVIRTRLQSDQDSSEVEQLRSEVDRLRTELERVRREKRQILDLRDEHTELVRVQQREQSLAERKAHASLLKRWKWKVTGMPEEE